MSEQVLETSETSEMSELSEIDGERDRDLGFGSVVAEQSRVRFLNRDGTFNVNRDGVSLLVSLNAYHSLMAMSWRRFLFYLLLLYFFSNIAFGAMYAALGPSALVDTSESPLASVFLRGFFFSVQTFATIGYGTIHPVGVVPNLLVTVESYYSLLANALVTGVVFARFARPTAKMVLSDVAVVAPYQDRSAFMFRLVNGRSSQLIEVRAVVMFARFVTENGRRIRRFDTLDLERRTVSFLPLSWTVVHPIDEFSPLFGMTEAEMKASEAEIMILLTGTDETFASAVHQRSSYKPNEILWGHRFVSIYNDIQPGDPISIDVRKLSKVEPAPLL
jgi:inward rectifier potassium channel